MNTEYIKCDRCAMPTVDIETDVCLSCGHRNRIIKSSAGWIILIPVAFAVTLFWWLW